MATFGTLSSIPRLCGLKYHQYIFRNIATTTSLNSRIIKKRVTRIPVDYSVHEHEVKEGSLGLNDSPPLTLINRNPRNLEQLCVEPKPLGWELESQSHNFWNRVTFEKNGKYLTAKVIHHSGRVIITASSKDPAFRAQVTGSGLTDINAARNLATIIAMKCFEAGILYFHKDLTEEQTSQKVQTFLSTLKEHGMKLKEPDMIFPRRIRDL